MTSQGTSLLKYALGVVIVGAIAGLMGIWLQLCLRDTYHAQAQADLRACGMSLERHYSRDFSYVGADENNVCNTNSPTGGEVHYIISYEELSRTGFRIRATR